MNTIIALWKRGLLIFVRDRTRLIITIIIPFFFVYVFSSVFKNDAIENPTTFLLAGVIIANVFQTSLNVASETIESITSGFMKEILVSPAKRIQIAVGQLLSATTIAVFQAILILIVGMFIGMSFTSWLTPLYAIGIMTLVGVSFSGLGLFMATSVKSQQTFQTLQQAVVLPMTFLSGAYLPISLLPQLLRYIAYINPMTYATAFFRTVLLEKGSLSIIEMKQAGLAFDVFDFTVTPWMSGVIVLIFGIFFLALSTRVFYVTDFSKVKK